MRRSVLPALALALCSVVSVAFLAGMLVSKLYWGYWLGPPLLDSRVMGADVIAFGGFTTEWCERSFADHLSPTKPPKPRNADPTEYPVEYTLLEMSRFGLSVHAHGELAWTYRR